MRTRSKKTKRGSEASERIAQLAAESESRQRAASATWAKLSGAIPGATVREAAPLVFSAMCRREGICVDFSETPKTDGRTIWLGEIDVTSPLAAVYVYGHGCHERHHIVHTDFTTVKSCPAGALRRLFNMFEDVRVDALGAAEYEGYLLWRDTLFEAYEAAGVAPWGRARARSATEALELWVLLSLEVSELGLTRFESVLPVLYAEAARGFSEVLLAELKEMVAARFPLGTSEDAYALARDVHALISQAGNAALRRRAELERALALELNAGKKLPLARSLLPSAAAQRSLFDGAGEVLLEAVPSKLLPGFDIANRMAEAYAEFREVGRTAPNEAAATAMRHLITTHETGAPTSVTDLEQPIERDTLMRNAAWRPMLEAMEKRFLALWKSTTNLAVLFQQALESRITLPTVPAEVGWELDDARLWESFVKEDRLFCREIPIREKNTAVQILLDASGSMLDEPFTLAKVAAARLYQALNAQRRTTAALALFPGPNGEGVGRVARQAESLGKLIERLAPVASIGPTPIANALFWAATKLMPRSEARKVIFVITDGRFEESRIRTLLSNLSALDITTVMLGIGEDSTPVGRIVERVPSVNELPRAIASILAALTAQNAANAAPRRA